jgi:hypothetical protein
MADCFAWGEVAYQSYFDHDWGGGSLAEFPAGRAAYVRRFRRRPGTARVAVKR